MTPHRCLIVDDHDQLRNLLCEWLKVIFPTVEFISASSGETALELVELHRPEVVLMDISLPGLNGVEATQRIKQHWPQTFVIIHTIHDDQAYHEHASLAGADVYISKSKTQAELVPALLKVFSIANDGEAANEDVVRKVQ